MMLALHIISAMQSVCVTSVILEQMMKKSLLDIFLQHHRIDFDEFMIGLLDDSNIVTLPYGLPWPKLNILDLSRNHIKEVSNLVFPECLEINLSDNQIRDISKLVLPNCLKKLNLAGNPITNINKLSLPKDCLLLL